MDRLTSMEVFVRVVDRGSFAGAAADLGLSPTMVGKHVAALEDRLGGRLLHRTTRRQSLTDLGREYCESCRAVLRAVEEAEANASDRREIPRGTLRVTAPVTLGTQRLAPALPAFLDRHPEVEVELILSDRVLDLVDQRVDVAIRIGRLTDSERIARPLRPYRFVACASPDYLALRGAPEVPDDLVRHACLAFTHFGTRDQWTFVGPDGPRTVTVGGRLRADNGQALRRAALAGLGILLQPEVLVEDDLRAGRLVALLPGYEAPARPVHLLYPRDRRATPALRAFVDFAIGALG